MTTFKDPLKVGGPDTGVPSTNTQSDVSFSRATTVSAGSNSATITLPGVNGSNITDIKCVVPTAVTSGAVAVLIGDTGDDDKYGTISVSAAGVYTATLGVGVVSAKEVIVNASASAFATGEVTTYITGFTTG